MAPGSNAAPPPDGGLRRKIRLDPSKVKKPIFPRLRKIGKLFCGLFSHLHHSKVLKPKLTERAESKEIKPLQMMHRRQVALLTLFAQMSFTQAIVMGTTRAHACADVPYLSQYNIGSKKTDIINNLSSACPAAITVAANMNGLVICESSRFGPKQALLIKNGVVAAKRTGANATCRWE